MRTESAFHVDQCALNLCVAEPGNSDFGTPNSLAQMVRRELMPALEAYAAQRPSGAPPLHVAKLEIDLGGWPADPSFGQLRQHLLHRLRQALETYERAARQGESAPPTHHEAIQLDPQKREGSVPNGRGSSETSQTRAVGSGAGKDALNDTAKDTVKGKSRSANHVPKETPQTAEVDSPIQQIELARTPNIGVDPSNQASAGQSVPDLGVSDQLRPTDMALLHDLAYQAMEKGQSLTMLLRQMFWPDLKSFDLRAHQSATGTFTSATPQSSSPVALAQVLSQARARFGRQERLGEAKYGLEQLAGSAIPEMALEGWLTSPWSALWTERADGFPAIPVAQHSRLIQGLQAVAAVEARFARAGVMQVDADPLSTFEAILSEPALKVLAALQSHGLELVRALRALVQANWILQNLESHDLERDQRAPALAAKAGPSGASETGEAVSAFSAPTRVGETPVRPSIKPSSSREGQQTPLRMSLESATPPVAESSSQDKGIAEQESQGSTPGLPADPEMSMGQARQQDQLASDSSPDLQAHQVSSDRSNLSASPEISVEQTRPQDQSASDSSFDSQIRQQGQLSSDPSFDSQARQVSSDRSNSETSPEMSVGQKQQQDQPAPDPSLEPEASQKPSDRSNLETSLLGEGNAQETSTQDTPTQDMPTQDRQLAATHLEDSQSKIEGLPISQHTAPSADSHVEAGSAPLGRNNTSSDDHQLQLSSVREQARASIAPMESSAPAPSQEVAVLADLLNKTPRPETQALALWLATDEGNSAGLAQTPAMPLLTTAQSQDLIEHSQLINALIADLWHGEPVESVSEAPLSQQVDEALAALLGELPTSAETLRARIRRAIGRVADPLTLIAALREDLAQDRPLDIEAAEQKAQMLDDPKSDDARATHTLQARALGLAEVVTSLSPGEKLAVPLVQSLRDFVTAASAVLAPTMARENWLPLLVHFWQVAEIKAMPQSINPSVVDPSAKPMQADRNPGSSSAAKETGTEMRVEQADKLEQAQVRDLTSANPPSLDKAGQVYDVAANHVAPDQATPKKAASDDPTSNQATADQATSKQVAPDPITLKSKGAPVGPIAEQEPRFWQLVLRLLAYPDVSAARLSDVLAALVNESRPADASHSLWVRTLLTRLSFAASFGGASFSSKVPQSGAASERAQADLEKDKKAHEKDKKVQEISSLTPSQISFLQANLQMLLGSQQQTPAQGKSPSKPEGGQRPAADGQERGRPIAPDAAPVPNIRSLVSDERQFFGSQVGGLVLLHPFVPTLFARLNLVDAKGQICEPERALAALAALAGAPLAEDVLALALLGLRLDARTLKPAELAEAEVTLIDELLDAVIDHWGALGQTSRQTLRTSFLQRNATVCFDERGGHVEVAHAAYDMLLDRLPWAINLLKFRWMAHPLHITWRVKS